jgi:hypothetical protein
MPNDDQNNLSVDEFCVLERISKSYYYKLRQAGGGPREIKLGRSIRITPSARREFHAAHEVQK